MQFLYVVKATATDEQKSKFCLQTQSTEFSYHIFYYARPTCALQTLKYLHSLQSMSKVKLIKSFPERRWDYHAHFSYAIKAVDVDKPLNL